jgi:hypothetical protein
MLEFYLERAKDPSWVRLKREVRILRCDFDFGHRFEIEPFLFGARSECTVAGSITVLRTVAILLWTLFLKF